jgi:hypothetical protein
MWSIERMDETDKEDKNVESDKQKKVTTLRLIIKMFKMKPTQSIIFTSSLMAWASSRLVPAALWPRSSLATPLPGTYLMQPFPVFVESRASENVT